jgi:hypothetical protein
MQKICIERDPGRAKAALKRAQSRRWREGGGCGRTGKRLVFEVFILGESPDSESGQSKAILGGTNLPAKAVGPLNYKKFFWRGTCPPPHVGGYTGGSRVRSPHRFGRGQSPLFAFIRHYSPFCGEFFCFAGCGRTKGKERAKGWVGGYGLDGLDGLDGLRWVGAQTEPSGYARVRFGVWRQPAGSSLPGWSGRRCLVCGSNPDLKCQT